MTHSASHINRVFPLRFLPVITLAFLLLPPLAAAQSRAATKSSPAAGYKLVAVKVTGNTRYTDKEILLASGLELGQTAAEGDFKEAAQRLGNSGLFSEVQYSFSYTDTDIKVEFHLVDSDKTKLVPAHFENFVWFTEPELQASLEQRVPLFKNMQLPATGQLPDRVSHALQTLLDERHLPGRVDYMREGKEDGGDITGITYRVEETTILIRKIDFPGASPEQAAFLSNAMRKLTGAEYSRARLSIVAHYDLLPLFLERGYLKAAFGQPDAHVIPPSSENSPPSDDDRASGETDVDAILPVTPGAQYSVSRVDWKGNQAVSTEEAAKLLHLAVAQPADGVRLQRDVESLAKLYHSRGYMKVQIKPDAQFNDSNSTVTYVINVDEGDLYRMGELEIIGVDSASKDRLREAWTLREGQPYNADYTRKFLENAVPFLPKGLRYSTRIDEDLDAKGKTVDVTIHFKTE